MKKICVLVATTAGPVCIERITPEPAPQSMVCLSRQSDVLAISADYDDFVRAGSGIIMREFGPYEEGAFRLDVSAKIGTGQSWQLGFFAAHAIYKSDDHELSSIEEAEQILWLSGMVDYDLKVQSVDHMAEKVEASAMVLSQAQIDKVPIIFAVSKENASFLKDKNPPAGIEILPLQTTHDLLAFLELKKTKSQKPIKKETAPNNSFWIMAALAGGAVSALLYSHFIKEGPTDTLEPSKENLILSISSDRGKAPTYYFGDNLQLQFETNRQAWLYCFYQQVDHNVLQIYPNPQVDQVTPFKPEQIHLISGDDDSDFIIRLGPPAGKEEVFCYASLNDLSSKLPDYLQGDEINLLKRQSVEQVFGNLVNTGLAFDQMTITLREK